MKENKIDSISPKKGRLTLITGPLFSGKTTKLLGKIKYFSRQKKRILVCKTSFDNRYRKNLIGTHKGDRFRALSLDSAKNFSDFFKKNKTNYDMVFFNEINFYNKDIIDVIQNLLDKGIDVYCDGLLHDWQRKYFEVTKKIMDISDIVIKLRTSCRYCFNLASFSKRLVKSRELFLIGGNDIYAACCKDCFEKN